MCKHEWELRRQSFSRDYGDRTEWECKHCGATHTVDYDLTAGKVTRVETTDAKR